MGQLSNQNTFSRISRLHGLVTGVQALDQEKRGSESDEQPTVVVAVRPRKRLSLEEETELIDAYREGEVVTALAARFQVHHSTVSKLLRRQGMSRSAKKLNSIHVSQTIDLYQSGSSLVCVASRIGCSPRTIRNTLETEGITRRDSHGRPRQLSG